VYQAKHLGDLIYAATTFNEPNIPMVLRWSGITQNISTAVEAMFNQAARAMGTDRFSSFVLGNPEKQRDVMLPAHYQAFAAMKSGPGKYPIGVNIAISDDQAVGANSQRDSKRAAWYSPWFEAAAKSDFVAGYYVHSQLGDKAIEHFKKSLELAPNHSAYALLGLTYLWMGNLDEGIRAIETSAQVLGRDPGTLGLLGFAHAFTG
jgi:beta-glucosidase